MRRGPLSRRYQGAGERDQGTFSGVSVHPEERSRVNLQWATSQSTCPYARNVSEVGLSLDNDSTAGALLSE